MFAEFLVMPFKADAACRHQAVLHLGLRQTEDLIGSILAQLCLDSAVPDHSKLNRRVETLEAALPRPSSAPV